MDRNRVGAQPGTCSWPARCGTRGLPFTRPTTHLVEWPSGWVDGDGPFYTYACAEDAQVIVDYQNGNEVAVTRYGAVTMREVGEGNW